MIVFNIDVMLARRKMSLTELSERVGITMANLSILKTGKAKAVRVETLNSPSVTSKVTEKKQNKNIDNATFLLIYNSNHAGSYDSAYSPGSKYRCKKQCPL